MATSTFSKMAKSLTEGRKQLDRMLKEVKHSTILAAANYGVNKSFNHAESFKTVKDLRKPSAHDLYATKYLLEYTNLVTMTYVELIFRENSQGSLKKIRESFFDNQLYKQVISDWIVANRKVYRLGKEFSLELEKVDLKITGDALLKGGDRTFFIEFPRVFRDTGDTYYGAFVSIVTADRLKDEKRIPYNPNDIRQASEALKVFNDDDKEGMRRLREVAASQHAQTGDANRIIVLAPTFSSTIPSFAYRHIRIDTEDIERCLSENIEDGIPNDMMSYILKAALYINSGAPDLREFRPDNMTKSERSEFERVHDCRADIPMTLVSWNWKKPVTYHTDSWVVSGHFRWQWCGKGLTNLELVWVKEHVKSHSSNKGEEVPPSPSRNPSHSA